ncbi:MAG: ubiquinol-cytochrome c reductase iron-sulfur subunit [Gammaproteobacteria bacterium]|jgi:ubiquinol-cytochrome c reductase iron-sulfur subunit
MTSNDSAVPTIDALRPEAGHSPQRRRFLATAAGVVGASAAALFADILIRDMNPGKAVHAQGAPVDVDISRLEPGQIMTVQWKKKPVWILHRPEHMLRTLDKPDLLKRLKDPHSKAAQQPAKRYVNGNYRALRPHIFVAVALCTHMQCVPDFRPAPHSVTNWWYGGFHCPCHGSTYDLSARVFAGSPAPVNIPIPPYYWKSDNVVRIGESTPGGVHGHWRPGTW